MQNLDVLKVSACVLDRTAGVSRVITSPRQVCRAGKAVT